jgi:hypothetical protein
MIADKINDRRCCEVDEQTWGTSYKIEKSNIAYAVTGH